MEKEFVTHRIKRYLCPYCGKWHDFNFKGKSSIKDFDSFINVAVIKPDCTNSAEEKYSFYFSRGVDDLAFSYYSKSNKRTMIGRKDIADIENPESFEVNFILKPIRNAFEMSSGEDKKILGFQFEDIK